VSDEKFKDDLVTFVRCLTLEEPKNIAYMSIEGKLYFVHYLKGLLHKNHKTLKFKVKLDEMEYTGTECLDGGECVIFDAKGKAHGFVLDNYEKHIQEKHYN